MNKIRSILKRASKIDMCYNTCLFIASSWGLDGDSLVFMRWSGGFLRDFLGRSFNMDDEFLVVYKYERFWRGSEPSIYAEIWCFSSYSPANGSQDCIPMSSYFPANGSQDCIPMSSYSTANGSQDSDCIPMSPYSKPLDLKTQNAFHESLFHCQIFGVFWLGTTHVLPSCFKRSHRDPKKLHSGAILGVPLYIPHGYP